MILDRIFGLIATVAFALGIVVQVELLSRALQPDPFDPLLVTYAALALTAIGYITLRADRKYGLIDPYDDSIDIVEVAYSLPTWARAVCFILAAYIALVFVGMVDAKFRNIGLLSRLPDELSVLQQSLPANGGIALFAALFLLTSFIIAAYHLVREPIKDFR